MELAIHWFRRDLRLEDNRALDEALQSGFPVQCIFIFDTYILEKLEDEDDARVSFLHQRLVELHIQLKERGSSLKVYHGKPEIVWAQLLSDFRVKLVFASHDYESYGMQRDQRISAFLAEQGIGFSTFKDCVIFEKSEVVKDDGKPYTVFTPYSKKWKKSIEENTFYNYSEGLKNGHFHKIEIPFTITLEELGFKASKVRIPDAVVHENLIRNYARDRNYPGISGTSRLGIHLRFGTISVRSLARQASSLNETFLNELIWRDFYHQILHHFPQVEKRSFKPAYESIQWLNNESDFQKWCKGETGYALVDAGMRELNASGFMHNRVRMVVASFLCKHLLIDYRWGEAWFARKLLDFELASNNGGWQWACGSGTDAAPYFRIFNPHEQLKKFDEKLQYVTKRAPEYLEISAPKPMIDHAFARNRCLETYKKALSNAEGLGVVAQAEPDSE